MKKIVLFMLLLFTVFAIGATGALASTIDFDANHEFYLTVQQLSNSAYLAPGSGNITTAFSDYAQNPSEGAAGSAGPTTITNMNNFQSVATNQVAGTWLQDRNGIVSYSGPIGSGQYGGAISHNFTALGPDPGLDPNGFVGQSNAKSGPIRTQLVHLVYTAPANDTYLINFTDTYSSTAAVDQTTGSLYPVNYFSGYAIMGVQITAGASWSDNAQLLYNNTVGTSGGAIPIASFSDIITNATFTLGSFSYLMTAGQTITLDAYLTSYYDAETTTRPVPVPPAVLLLGSGLIGLIGIRRKLTK